MSSSSSLPATNPYRSPSYPPRTHFNEQKALLDLLQAWNQRLEGGAKKLQVLGASKERVKLERLYHQTMGARDQIAELARRMPRETAALYDDDLERLRITQATLERLAREWEAAGL